MTYSEDEYLMLSGIQHFSFCRRQWALIHIEQIWHENLLTTEGRIVHERAHDSAFNEKRRDLLVIRGMNVHSAELGVSGQCDVVEFHQVEENGVQLHGRKGLWVPFPVEYKQGTIKLSDADRLQLCCQSMCLEEMLLCTIDKGYLYYNEIRKREEVTVGFLHRDRPGRCSLALDLMEELRSVLSDRFCLYLVNLKRIKPEHFEIKENEACFLNTEGKKVFLAAWQKRKQETIRHPFLDEKLEWGLVPYAQALLLARYLRGDLDEYPPFLWK